jgi:hypothetical protein
MKKGLKEFRKIYDIECKRSSLFLDLAQNLRYRFDIGNKEITEDDIKICREIFDLNFKSMDSIHKLAFKLGFTGEDYIENSRERRKESKCNVYVAGVGSLDYKEGNE